MSSLHQQGEDGLLTVDASLLPPSGAHIVMNDPELCLFPNFISDSEINDLFMAVDGDFAWAPCAVWRGGHCRSRTGSCITFRTAANAVVRLVETRAAQIAGYPIGQMERLNLQRYLPGQRFQLHHDGSGRPKTVFIYLNSVVEGGETRFPALGIQIKPVKGCAVVWSNYLPNGEEDERMFHEGLPPASGVKYVLNCFIGRAPRSEEDHLFSWSKHIMSVGRRVEEINLQKLWEVRHPTLLELECIEIWEDPKYSVIFDFLSALEINGLLTEAEGCAEGTWKHAVPGDACCTQEVIDLQAVNLGLQVHEWIERLARILSIAEDNIQSLYIERFLPGTCVLEQRVNHGISRAVLVYLQDLTECGEDGVTTFRGAMVQFTARPGTALVWGSMLPDGDRDARMGRTELPCFQTTRYYLIFQLSSEPLMYMDGLD